MPSMRPFIVPLAAAASLAGCSTTSPVEVTRFHLATPIAPATFAVEQGVPAGMAAPQALGQGTIEAQSYDGIVGGELQRLGFTRVPTSAQAELVATVTVDRGAREDLAARQSGFSFGLGGVGFGGGGGGYRHGGGTAIGGGAGVTVPVGGNSPHYITGTRLMVQLKRRSDGTVMWEGRAQTEAKAQSPDAQPDAAVAKLAHALFAGFPGESGRTITVR